VDEDDVKYPPAIRPRQFADIGEPGVRAWAEVSRPASREVSVSSFGPPIRRPAAAAAVLDSTGTPLDSASGWHSSTPDLSRAAANALSTYEAARTTFPNLAARAATSDVGGEVFVRDRAQGSDHTAHHRETLPGAAREAPAASQAQPAVASDEAPPDRFYFVFFSICLLGVVGVYPFFTLMSNPKYIRHYYQHASNNRTATSKMPGIWEATPGLVMTASSLPNMLRPVMATKPLRLVRYTAKFTVGIFFQYGCLLTFLLVPIIGVPEHIAIVLLLFGAFCSGLGNAVITGTAYALAASFPRNYVQSMALGAVFSGAVASIMQIVTMAFFSQIANDSADGFDDQQHQARAFWAIGVGFVTLSWATTYSLSRSAFAQFYVEQFRPDSGRPVTRHLSESPEDLDRLALSSGPNIADYDGLKVPLFQREAVPSVTTTSIGGPRVRGEESSKRFAGADDAEEDSDFDSEEWDRQRLLAVRDIDEEHDARTQAALQTFARAGSPRDRLAGARDLDDSQSQRSHGGARPNSSDVRGMLEVLSFVKSFAAAIFFVSFGSALTMPGLATRRHTHSLWFGVLVITAFNVTHFLGRVASQWQRLALSARSLFALTAVRLTAVPVFVLMARPRPDLIDSDVPAYVVAGIVGLTHGMFSAQVTLLAPSAPGLVANDKPVAGTIMSSSVAFAWFVGTGLQFLFGWLYFGQGNSATGQFHATHAS